MPAVDAITYSASVGCCLSWCERIPLASYSFTIEELDPLVPIVSRSKEERVYELADSSEDLKIQPEMPIFSSREIELKRYLSGTKK